MPVMRAYLLMSGNGRRLLCRCASPLGAGQHAQAVFARAQAMTDLVGKEKELQKAYEKDEEEAEGEEDDDKEDEKEEDDK